MIRIAGLSGIAFGTILLILGATSIFVVSRIVALVGEVPVVGPWLMDLTRQVIYFPYGEYLLLALGIFAIFWGTSLLRKENWARIVGAVLYGTGAAQIGALLMVVVSLEELGDSRWWIGAIGLFLAALFAYIAYYLFHRDALSQFTQPFYNANDLDLPPNRPMSQPEPPGPQPPLRQSDGGELARLTPIGDNHGGTQAFIIRDRSVIVGRIGSHLTLDPTDTSISRQHATISLTGDQFILEDNSRNGTTVNGQLVKNGRVPLQNGAEILFGRNAKFTFTMVQPADAASPNSPRNQPPQILARLHPLWPEGKLYEMAKATVVLGRDPNKSDLILPLQEDLTVSSRHAEIAYNDQNQFVLRDLQSANGTFVNQTRITEAELVNGAEFQLGTDRTRFRFERCV